jgi:enoyl-CoA hydratase/carnithine racemase
MADDPSNPDGRINMERRGSLLLMGIDRPHKFNGFTPKMTMELGDAYSLLEWDDELRCGVLHAVGPHTTAGLDMPKMAPHRATSAPLFGEGNIDCFGLVGPHHSKPLVAAVQGITYTIGIELMLACDIVIAAEDCRFSQLEVQRNLMATGGATIRMVQRAGYGNAMRYLLTDDEFDAATALRFNYIQEVVPTGQQLDRAIKLAEKICAQAPLAVRATIANSRKYLEHGFAAAVADLATVNVDLGKTSDAKEGLAAFVEKRPAKFTGT